MQRRDYLFPKAGSSGMFGNTFTDLNSSITKISRGYSSDWGEKHSIGGKGEIAFLNEEENLNNDKLESLEIRKNTTENISQSHSEHVSSLMNPMEFGSEMISPIQSDDVFPIVKAGEKLRKMGRDEYLSNIKNVKQNDYALNNSLRNFHENSLETHFASLSDAKFNQVTLGKAFCFSKHEDFKYKNSVTHECIKTESGVTFSNLKENDTFEDLERSIIDTNKLGCTKLSKKIEGPSFQGKSRSNLKNQLNIFQEGKKLDKSNIFKFTGNRTTSNKLQMNFQNSIISPPQKRGSTASFWWLNNTSERGGKSSENLVNAFKLKLEDSARSSSEITQEVKKRKLHNEETMIDNQHKLLKFIKPPHEKLSKGKELVEMNIPEITNSKNSTFSLAEESYDQCRSSWKGIERVNLYDRGKDHMQFEMRDKEQNLNMIKTNRCASDSRNIFTHNLQVNTERFRNEAFQTSTKCIVSEDSRIYERGEKKPCLGDVNVIHQEMFDLEEERIANDVMYELNKQQLLNRNKNETTFKSKSLYTTGDSYVMKPQFKRKIEMCSEKAVEKKDKLDFTSDKEENIWENMPDGNDTYERKMKQNYNKNEGFQDETQIKIVELCNNMFNHSNVAVEKCREEDESGVELMQSYCEDKQKEVNECLLTIMENDLNVFGLNINEHENDLIPDNEKGVKRVTGIEVTSDIIISKRQKIDYSIEGNTDEKVFRNTGEEKFQKMIDLLLIEKETIKENNTDLLKTNNVDIELNQINLKPCDKDMLTDTHDLEEVQEKKFTDIILMENPEMTEKAINLDHSIRDIQDDEDSRILIQENVSNEFESLEKTVFTLHKKEVISEKICQENLGNEKESKETIITENVNYYKDIEFRYLPESIKRNDFKVNFRNGPVNEKIEVTDDDGRISLKDEYFGDLNGGKLLLKRNENSIIHQNSDFMYKDDDYHCDLNEIEIKGMDQNDSSSRENFKNIVLKEIKHDASEGNENLHENVASKCNVRSGLFLSDLALAVQNAPLNLNSPTFMNNKNFESSTLSDIIRNKHINFNIQLHFNISYSQVNEFNSLCQPRSTLNSIIRPLTIFGSNRNFNLHDKEINYSHNIKGNKNRKFCDYFYLLSTLLSNEAFLDNGGNYQIFRKISEILGKGYIFNDNNTGFKLNQVDIIYALHHDSNKEFEYNVFSKPLNEEITTSCKNQSIEVINKTIIANETKNVNEEVQEKLACTENLNKWNPFLSSGSFYFRASNESLLITCKPSSLMEIEKQSNSSIYNKYMESNCRNSENKALLINECECNDKEETKYCEWSKGLISSETTFNGSSDEEIMHGCDINLDRNVHGDSWSCKCYNSLMEFDSDFESIAPSWEERTFGKMNKNSIDCDNDCNCRNKVRHTKDCLICGSCDLMSKDNSQMINSQGESSLFDDQSYKTKNSPIGIANEKLMQDVDLFNNQFYTLEDGCILKDRPCDTYFIKNNESSFTVNEEKSQNSYPYAERETENKSSLPSIISEETEIEIVSDTEGEIKKYTGDRLDHDSFLIDEYIDSIIEDNCSSQKDNINLPSESSLGEDTIYNEVECQTNLGGIMKTFHTSTCLENLFSESNPEYCSIDQITKRKLQALNLEIKGNKRFKSMDFVTENNFEEICNKSDQGKNYDILLRKRICSEVFDSSTQTDDYLTECKTDEETVGVVPSKTNLYPEQEFEDLLNDQVQKMNTTDQKVPDVSQQFHLEAIDGVSSKQWQNMNSQMGSDIHKSSSVSKRSKNQSVLRLGLSKRVKLRSLHHMPKTEDNY